MNAIIAQAAALAAHARARRIDPKLGGDEDYWTRHSTFQFVRSLRFAVGKRRLFWSSATDIASTPPQWMATLPLNDDVSFVSVRSSITRTGNPASGLLGVAQEPVAIQTGASPALWVPSWRTV